MPRPRKTARTDEMLNVVRLFYSQNLSKKEIAEELGIYARDVTWLLSEARLQGLVTIHIHETVQSDLEDRIKQRFAHLERVLIVPGPAIKTEEQCDDFFRRAGVLAADYFEKLVEKHPPGRTLHVGVTGGERLLEFATAVPKRRRDSVRVHVTALVGRGRLGDTASHVEPNVTASILWTHCGSIPGHCEYETVEPYRFNAGPGPDSREALAIELNRLQRIPAIKSVIRDLDDLDVVFGGLGFQAVESRFRNRIAMGSLLKSVATPEQLHREGAIGDFCYCPFDKNGDCPPENDWRFFLTAGHYSRYKGIDFYKRMVELKKKVVAFGGPGLLPAIKAALIGKLFNVLVIDEHMARQLLGDV
jgi:DNA-binding transcriptional regulator LsrR (DeoR family)